MSDEQTQLSSSEAGLAKVPGAKLSEAESADIFEAAWAGREESAQDDEAEVVELRGEASGGSNAGLWGRYAAAAALLLMGGLVGWLVATQTGEPDSPVSPDDEYTGIKSPAPPRPHIELQPMVGRMEAGRPTVSGQLGPGEKLEPGERVLFRYDLRTPARVVLLGQGQGGQVEVLWKSPGQMPAGDTELQANGQALGLDPGRYEGAFRLAIVALPDAGVTGPEEAEMLTESALQKACPKCGFDIVQLEAP